MINKFKYYALLAITALIFTGAMAIYKPFTAQAFFGGHPPRCCECGITCSSNVSNCSSNCQCQSDRETPVDTQYFTDLAIEQREWLINVVWEAHLLPAMMLMTEQITAAATSQVMMIGTLFDAKHQLESQRILQSLTAEAHAQYQPSVGMCQFGTLTRSLTSSERNKEITQIAMASRSSQRQALNGDGISAGGRADDLRSRYTQVKNVYCNPTDLSNGMVDLCAAPNTARSNRDIDFTALSQEKNLNLRFTNTAASADEADVLSMQANLYGHRVMPRIPEDRLSDVDGNITRSGAQTYLEMRAILAKRSIAEAAFAAYVAERTESVASMQPYMEGALREMGVNATEARALFGTRPSYHTQMYFLTNTMYQNPQFYADLYDKPENVDRKKVSMQAINLKLRSDMYDSQIRSNAIQSVLLETLLDEYEDKFVNEANIQQQQSNVIALPGLY